MNNLGKVLYRKLAETIERYADGLDPIAAKAPKKDGKGKPYVDVMGRHMPFLDAMRTASRKSFIAVFCG